MLLLHMFESVTEQVVKNNISFSEPHSPYKIYIHPLYSLVCFNKILFEQNIVKYETWLLARSLRLCSFEGLSNWEMTMDCFQQSDTERSTLRYFATIWLCFIYIWVLCESKISKCWQNARNLCFSPVFHKRCKTGCNIWSTSVCQK